MEKNKGKRESRTIETRPVAAEDIGFPFAAQVARITRQREGRQDETVGLITDQTADQLAPLAWLEANRQGWGVENGLHQRLDVSLNDDRCRVRNPKALLILGMVRRLVISLFMEWRQRQRKPQFCTVTDFQAAMGENDLAAAMSLVTQKRSRL